MAYSLGDVFIGKAPRIQNFGEKPDFYNARYGLKGHNGVDWATPPLTPILAAADGWVLEVGFDYGAYGNVIKLVHDGYLTTYGHLNDIAIKQNERVVAGQLIGHSNGTGLCDTPHLHFGVAPCDGNGGKTQKDNGFGGYIDPLSSLCNWLVQNLTEPVVPGTIEPKVSLPSAAYSQLNTQAGHFKVVASALLAHGLNEYLASRQIPPLDLENNPNDQSAAEHAVEFLNEKLAPHVPAVGVSQSDVLAPLAHVPAKQLSRNGFFFAFRKFIFTRP